VVGCERMVMWNRNFTAGTSPSGRIVGQISEISSLRCHPDTVSASKFLFPSRGGWPDSGHLPHHVFTAKRIWRAKNAFRVVTPLTIHEETIVMCAW